MTEKRIRVGVITTYLSEYIFPSIIRGIEDTFKKNDVVLLLSSTNNDHENERHSIEKMIEAHVDGLIIEPTSSNKFNPNIDIYLKLKELNIPYIMINGEYDMIDSSSITFNDYMAGFDMTRFLIENGHINIAALIKYDDLQGKNRLKGYIDALKEASINKTFIHTYRAFEDEMLVRDFLDSFREREITGILCYNDNLASIIYKRAHNMDLEIPKDLSVVGIDDSMISESLNLTTYNHPKIKLGRMAAEWILKDIKEDNKDKLRKYQFDGNIVIRESVLSINK